MIKLGFIGWRGIVGSILLNRIKTSFILKYSELFLFSTNKILINNFINYAYNLNLLKNMNIIICCQGSEYTKKILKKLKLINWKGYWIDASSFLRMKKNVILILDLLNKKYILNNIKNNKIYSGCNCTVSLCLLSIKKLLEFNLIEWIFTSSYQSISGAGYYLINKLNKEILISNNTYIKFKNIEKNLKNKLKNPIFYNIIPWIDKKVNFSQTKEEWKSQSEASKILNYKIYIDSTCVRINSFRCHSQSFYIKLKKKLFLNDFYNILNYEYIKIIKNNEINTFNNLNSFNVSNKLKIFIGKIRKNIINNIFNIFNVGDQLLWGAAEPIKRFIEILIEYLL